MFCRKCGKSIADNSEFCNYCGERVIGISTNGLKSNSDSKLKCAKCFSDLNVNKEYCDLCGAFNPYYGSKSPENYESKGTSSTVDLRKPLSANSSDHTSQSNLKCKRCLSRLDNSKEYCDSCGALNPYYGTRSKTTSVSSSQPQSQSSNNTDNGRTTGDGSNIRRWVVLVIIVVIVALIMISSGDSSMRGTGESLMKGVLKSGLRVGAIVLIPIVIGAIVKAVKKNK